MFPKLNKHAIHELLSDCGQNDSKVKNWLGNLIKTSNHTIRGGGASGGPHVNLRSFLVTVTKVLTGTNQTHIFITNTCLRHLIISLNTWRYIERNQMHITDKRLSLAGNSASGSASNQRLAIGLVTRRKEYIQKHLNMLRYSVNLTLPISVYEIYRAVYIIRQLIHLNTIFSRHRELQLKNVHWKRRGWKTNVSFALVQTTLRKCFFDHWINISA